MITAEGHAKTEKLGQYHNGIRRSNSFLLLDLHDGRWNHQIRMWCHVRCCHSCFQKRQVLRYSGPLLFLSSWTIAGGIHGILAVQTGKVKEMDGDPVTPACHCAFCWDLGRLGVVLGTYLPQVLTLSSKCSKSHAFKWHKLLNMSTSVSIKKPPGNLHGVSPEIHD